MLERLRSQLDADRLIDAEVFCIDGTDIRDGRAIDPVMGAVQLTGRRERPTCRPVKPAGDKDCSGSGGGSPGTGSWRVFRAGRLHHKSCSEQHLFQVVVVPASSESLRLHSHLPALLVLQQAQGHSPDDSEVGVGLPSSDATSVFTEKLRAFSFLLRI